MLCRIGSLTLTCCNIIQLLPSDAWTITLIVVNLLDYNCIIMLSIENYHQNDMNNAKWHMWCLKLNQYIHISLKKVLQLFCEVVLYCCKNIYVDIMYIPKASVFTVGSFQTFKYQCSLDVTDLDWGSNAKPRVKGLRECGLEPVQEGHAVVFYAVECQHACGVVQVHTYPRGVWSVNGRVHAVVPGWVARVGAKEAPGLVVVAQQAQRAFALPADALVSHPNGELPAPLDLPVEAASRQSLAAQHLGEAVEPLLVVRIGLQVPGADDLPAVLRDVELLVGRVGVQLELTKVCRRRIRSLMPEFGHKPVSHVLVKCSRHLHFTNSPLLFGSAAGEPSTASLPAKKQKQNTLSAKPDWTSIYPIICLEVMSNVAISVF